MIRSALIVTGLVALIASGGDARGKLALLLRLPGLAAQSVSSPDVRGVMLYDAGDYAAADASFQQAGRGSTYNRGLSLAATGNYPLSRAYFDAVLFANPSDSQARENRNVVNALIPPLQGEGNGTGRIATVVIATPGGSPVAEARRLGRPLDEGKRVADAAWLATLPDDPGEFLRLRLRDEYGRRLSMGLTAPDKGDPW